MFILKFSLFFFLKVRSIAEVTGECGIGAEVFALTIASALATPFVPCKRAIVSKPTGHNRASTACFTTTVISISSTAILPSCKTNAIFTGGKRGNNVRGKNVFQGRTHRLKRRNSGVKCHTQIPSKVNLFTSHETGCWSVTRMTVYHNSLSNVWTQRKVCKMRLRTENVSFWERLLLTGCFSQCFAGALHTPYLEFVT